MVRDEFLLQRVQPAMVGLIDGSLSTLAPIFAIALHTHKPFDAFIAGVATAIGAGSAIALHTHKPFDAFIAGVATAIGAGISMAFSEGLSDTGELTGRGNPAVRGTITGVGTFVGGILHTLPFLIPSYPLALYVAIGVVAFELLALAILRWHFFETSFARS